MLTARACLNSSPLIKELNLNKIKFKLRIHEYSNYTYNHSIAMQAQSYSTIHKKKPHLTNHI